jgi:two-component system, NarL family, invasion response regulator UvrY
MIKVALADDHKLLRNALATLINSYGDCQVVMEANNGKDLCDMIKIGQPDVVILDFNMPEMNGYECAEWLKNAYPDIHVLMLTMYDTELMLIKMLQSGVKGFMKKDIHPNELHRAIHSVISDGFYYSTYTSSKLAGFFRESTTIPFWEKLMSESELNFMKLVCSEMTYKEIAQIMNMNPRTVDALRDSLFEKLEVKSRVGLAMYAIKHGLVSI